MIPAGIGRYQAVTRRILKPLVSRLWRFEVHGLDNVPATGPAVLCPNHVAAIDSAFIPAVLDRNLIYVGKAEYLDDWKTAKLFPAMGMIPIDRRGGDHAAAALDAAKAVLNGGGLFGIYPEGTRSRSGKLHKGHTGAARLAIETGAPIIPVGISGTGEIQPVDSVVPRFFRPVTIRFGAPITVDRYRHRVGDRALYRELTDEIMYEIQQLTGLEYVHVYAGDHRTEEVGDRRTATTPDRPGRPSVEPAMPVRPPTPTIERLSSADVLVHRPLVPLAEALAAS